MLKVGIVDRRDVAALGLAKILQDHPSIEPIPICGSAMDRIYELVMEYRPDVILVDIGYVSTELLRKVHEKLPELRFIAVTHHVNQSECCFVFGFGAGAYLSKDDVKVSNIAEIMLLVADGKCIISAEIAQQVICGQSADLDNYFIEQPTRKTLSRRETDVLSLVAQGSSNGEIASELKISVHTVRVHLRNIMEKLGAHNRLHAVYLAGMQEHAAGLGTR